ncbi:restriction endonuclease subunit S [Proteus genomosp. 6]|uniref:restriction endonuclease subunit S n=1 Tax=Proteus genomosp. 6 TaxID=1311820 RepID=UPI0013A53165|nr:restriction endonuclease subunit S [Proteus genomosp. 6]
MESLALMPKYEAYKDSQVQWIGDIPANWHLEKAKWLFYKADRKPLVDDDIVTCFRDGQVTLRKNRRTEGFTNALKEHGYQRICKGDLVIHAMDAFAGAIGVSDSDGKSTPVYAACVPRKKGKVNSYYYAYYMRDLALSGFIVSLAKGIRERSTDFRFNDFAELLLPFPDYEEQTLIANFLDKKTTQIDDAIAIKEQQISLLKERKQIIIQQAVTQGLDPNVPMKDSGVDWIGKIPAHWEVKKMKTFARIKNGIDYKHVESDSGYSVYGSGGQFTFANRFLYKGEAVLLGRKGTIDKPLYVNEAFWTVDTMFYAVCNTRVVTKYLYFCATTIPFGFYSTATALPSMTQTDLLNHKFAVPSFSEQLDIIAFIEDKEFEIEECIKLQRQQISKLKEYKTTLINSAVTGKIKITPEMVEQ